MLRRVNSVLSTQHLLPLYETLIERDISAIPGAVRAIRDEHGSEEAYRAIGRFAVLAYSPSQHGKHAVLACLAAWALRGEPYFDDVVTQCAIYAAESRQPWSEPPIMSPPAIDDDQRGDLDELLEAIAASDRLRGERWLAKRLDDGDLARDYFAAAADDFDDLGHKLIVADAAWRLVPILGERGPFVALQPGGRRAGSGVRSLGEKIAEAGYRVIVYDRRNTGASGIAIEGESENDATDSDDDAADEMAEKLAELKAGADDDDPELAAYNRYLAWLAADPSRRPQDYPQKGA